MTNLDQLQSCKMELSLMQNIYNMRDYAAAWLKLSRAYRSVGFRANADYCRSRGAYYSRLARISGGEYVRLIESPVAELIFVDQP
jgi:hypothetical protein